MVEKANYEDYPASDGQRSSGARSRTRRFVDFFSRRPEPESPPEGYIPSYRNGVRNRLGLDPPWPAEKATLEDIDDNDSNRGSDDDTGRRGSVRTTFARGVLAGISASRRKQPSFVDSKQEPSPSTRSGDDEASDPPSSSAALQFYSEPSVVARVLSQWQSRRRLLEDAINVLSNRQRSRGSPRRGDLGEEIPLVAWLNCLERNLQLMSEDMSDRRVNEFDRFRVRDLATALDRTNGWLDNLNLVLWLDDMRYEGNISEGELIAWIARVQGDLLKVQATLRRRGVEPIKVDQRTLPPLEQELLPPLPPAEAASQAPDDVTEVMLQMQDVPPPRYTKFDEGGTD